MEYFGGHLCEVWKNVTVVGHKKNTYRLWVARPEGGASLAKPYHYEMMGFNTLLGSHYDKYLIDYSDFSPRTNPEDFNLPEGKLPILIFSHLRKMWLCFIILKCLIDIFLLGTSCGPFPGPGVEHRILANPIQDLIHTSPVGHAHRLFGHFKEKYERNYEDEVEHEKREHNFVHNVR